MKWIMVGSYTINLEHVAFIFENENYLGQGVDALEISFNHGVDGGYGGIDTSKIVLTDERQIKSFWTQFLKLTK